MKKLVLTLAALYGCATIGHTQYLYGISNAAGVSPALVRFDPANNSFTTLIKSFEYYQPSSTKDTTNKIIYFSVPDLNPSGTRPDTLVTVKLADSSVTKKPIPKGGLPLPLFDKGKLISCSANGMATYDVATGQYTLVDTNVKASGIHSADFDHARGRYIFMKRSPSNIPDTLLVYTMATRQLQKFAVGVAGSSNEMRYSPTSDKAVFIGVPPNTAAYGLYSFKLSTQTFALEALLANSGTQVNCATIDEVNDRYFCVKVTNTTGTGFNILEYRLSTSTVVDHLVGPPGLAFPQYFDNLHLPRPVNTGIGAVQDEPLFLYPNPASTRLRVRVERKGQAALLQVIDLSGKEVLAKTMTNDEEALDISQLPVASYMLRVSLGDRSYGRLFTKAQ